MPRKVYTRFHMAWTQATIDSIIATPKAVEKSENNLLIIRSAKPDGKVTWFAYVDRKRTMIGDARVVSLKEAKRIKDDLLFNSRQGVTAPTKLTFKEFIEHQDFLDWSRGERVSHDEEMKSLYGVVVPFLGNIKLSKIDEKVLDRYVNWRRSKNHNRPLANSTIQRNLTSIQSVMSLARKYKLINHELEFPHLKIDKGIEKRILTKQEETRLIEALSADDELSEYHANKRKHVPLYLSIALYTGARKSEILKLTWGDIKDTETKWKEITTVPLGEEDEESVHRLKEDYTMLVESTNEGAYMLQFEGSKNKTRQTRLVPTGMNLALMLTDYYQKHVLYPSMSEEEFLDWTKARVVGNKVYSAKPIREEDKKLKIFPMKNVRTSFETLVKRAGLPSDITFHSLRHTFITRSLDATKDIHTVARWAGHADLKTTQQYLHLLEKESILEKHKAYADTLNIQ